MNEEVSKASLSAIKFDRGNANKGSVRGRGMIEASMRDFGFADAGTLDRNNVIIGGNKRTEVAGEIELSDEAIIIDVDGTKPVFIRRNDLDLSDPNDDRARKLAYALNRTSEVSMQWDAEQLLADIGAGLDLSALFRDDELDALLAELQPKTEVNDGGAQVDRAEELRQKWNVHSDDLWQLGEHRLICGDCTDANVVARVMGGDKCDALIFDPPWDVAFDAPSGKWANVLTFTDGRRAGDIVRLFGAPTWVFIWDCVTSWYAPNHPLQRHKSCFWYGNIENFQFNGAHYGEPGEAKTVTNTRGTYNYVPDQRGKHLSDVFQKQITNLDEDEFHKHQKPVDWFRLLIGDCTAGNVYDPFIASGTTMVACQQLERRCFGCEIDPGMVAVVLERMSDLGLSPIRVN